MIIAVVCLFVGAILGYGFALVGLLYNLENGTAFWKTKDGKWHPHDPRLPRKQ